ncbi:MFP1 attachment factor 1 [Morella rubra]|uniref:MFP1 attachment factor 1 n=1 Tax=Morella rubra TaxID=262757 RepID=A0A6A1UJF9_9ROSI|nr:MFP1 attachment factor 1 [Morella rubra]
MAEANELNPQVPHETKAPKPNFSFSIWPPSQRIRDAAILRLAQTLSSSSSSIIANSKRYASLTADEASAAACVIEEQALLAAADTAAADDVGGRIEKLGVYAKEISKRALEMLKARAAQVTAEELSPVKPESS